MAFMVGCVLAAILAAIIEFAVLPQVITFVGFSAVLGLYLIPIGALMLQPWQGAVFFAMVANIIPLLAPTNTMTYDTVQFYNNALAILGGTGTAALSFRLWPPLSPVTRTCRLLTLALRDLRRLATLPVPADTGDWNARMYSRLVAMPSAAEPLARARLLAALSLGEELTQLRQIVDRLGADKGLETALDAFAHGEIAETIARLAAFDSRLASIQDDNPAASDVLRARSAILAISEALSHHASFFGAMP
jgi:uncharacterized membrane protein YccC